MNIRKKIAAVFFTLMILPSISLAGDLSIDSITFTPPVNTCEWEWHATVTNNSSQAYSGNIAVQGSQGCSGCNWDGATGTSITNMQAGQTVTKTGRWIRNGGSDQFKISLYFEGNSLEERTVPLPQEGPVNLSIDNGTFNDGGYNIVVRNNTANPASNVSVQCYMANNSTPDDWTPCGGGLIQCVDGAGTANRQTNRSAGWNGNNDMYKIQLMRGSDLLHEDILGNVPVQTEEETDAAVSRNE